MVRVSPSLSLAQLLLHICERRNLEPRQHWFDLPATPESLADKTLEQLKINTLRVIETGAPHVRAHLHIHTLVELKLLQCNI